MYNRSVELIVDVYIYGIVSEMLSCCALGVKFLTLEINVKSHIRFQKDTVSLSFTSPELKAQGELL